VLNRYDARNLGKPPIRIQETNEAAIANISKFARSGMEGARQRSGKDAWTDIGSVRSLRNDELMAILDPADMPVIPRDFQTAQHRMRKQFQKTRFDTRFDFSTSQFPWEFSMKRVKKKNARTFDAWLEVRPTLPDELAPSLSKSQVWLGNFDEESGSGEARIFYLHDRVVVFFRTEVFAVELPKYDGPPEFRLMWPDIGPLSAEKIEEVKLPIVGGDGKYRMALERSMVGLRLNTRDGTLLVDGPQFWKANLKDFQIHQNLMSPAPRGDRQHEWKRQYHKRYESTYGFRLPKGKLPALIPISIVANDGSGNRDQISFYLLMHGDPVAQPEVVRKETRDKVKEEKQKSVQLARRLDSVEQSFDASLRSLSIIESLLKQKLDRLKSETEKKGKSRKQKEAERKS
jgi:hypothetical protein